MIPHRIFLVGFMCSGKSTVGKVLAQKLSYSFVDLDEEIEKREGTSIEEIFSNHGEEHFRRLEFEVLEEFLKKERVVVSTGGGLGANKEAMERMRYSGLVIWLEIDFETFLKRCGSSEGRPLLKKGLDYVRELMKRREKIYNMANIKVDGRKSVEDTLEDIYNFLKHGHSQNLQSHTYRGG